MGEQYEHNPPIIRGILTEHGSWIYIYIDFLNLNIPQLITYGCDNGCVMLYIHVYPGLMQGHEK